MKDEEEFYEEIEEDSTPDLAREECFQNIFLSPDLPEDLPQHAEG